MPQLTQTGSFRIIPLIDVAAAGAPLRHARVRGAAADKIERPFTKNPYLFNIPYYELSSYELSSYELSSGEAL